MAQANTKYQSAPSIQGINSLGPQAQRVVNALVEEIFREKVTLDDLLVMYRVCPITSTAVALKAMRAVTALGKYVHPNKTSYPMPSGATTVEEWVRDNFESMKGNLTQTVRRMVAQVYSLGFSIAQIVWTTNQQGFGREWRLGKLNLLDPRRVQRFDIRNGEIHAILYREYGGRMTLISYENVIHLYTDCLEGVNPRGWATSRRAYPFFKARQLFFQAWAVAGQKQATGTTVIQAPSEKFVVLLNELGVPQSNPDGTPKTVSAVEAAKKAAEGLENSDVLATDLENKVFNLVNSAGENFFNIATTAFKKEILMCHGTPSTIFDDTNSSIGSSGINAGHRLILDVQIDSIVLEVKEEILEKIVRPLLTWNFGIRNNFGDFNSEKFLDPSMALTRVSNLITAFSTNTLDANDIDAVNRLREDLGLPTVSKEQFDQLQIEKLMAQQRANDAYAQSQSQPQ